LSDNRDLVLAYAGGSGGFILLHVLLISGLYKIVLGDGKDLASVIDQQWSITDAAEWKIGEVWPDNRATAALHGRPCIFFYCNPDLKTFLTGQDTTSVAHLLQCYQDIKDKAWPDISCFEDYLNLDAWIRKECESMHNIDISLFRRVSAAKKVCVYTDCHAQNELSWYKKAYIYRLKQYQNKRHIPGTEFRGKLVDCKIIDCLFHCDRAIYLQDFVNRPDILIDEGLLGEINTAQLNLLERWKRLHPQTLLQDIAIDI